MSHKQNPRIKIQCQYCHATSYTRHLDFDVICKHCGKYAKRSWQKFKETKKLPLRTNQVERQIFVLKSVTCPNCEPKEALIFA